MSSQEDLNEGSMSLTGHLAELRTRLVRVGFAIGIGTTAAFAFGNQLLRLLLIPVPEGVTITQIDVLEGVGVRMKVALLGGFILAFPVILHQAVMFLRPALLPHERRFLYGALPVVTALYIGGVLFSFFVLIPPIMIVLPNFLGDLAEPEIRISSQVGTTLWFLFVMGIIFETPVVMYLLARVGILDPTRLTRHRRVAVLGAFVAGAIVTPTGDPITMTIWALPILMLYEIGLQLSKLAWRGRQRALNRMAQPSEGR